MIPGEVLKVEEEEPMIEIEKKGDENKEATHLVQSGSKPKAFKIGKDKPSLIYQMLLRNEI